MTNSTFCSAVVSGEAVVEMLREADVAVPRDAILMKVVHTESPNYAFVFVFHSKEDGWETAEGAIIARGMK